MLFLVFLYYHLLQNPLYFFLTTRPCQAYLLRIRKPSATDSIPISTRHSLLLQFFHTLTLHIRRRLLFLLYPFSQFLQIYINTHLGHVLQPQSMALQENFFIFLKFSKFRKAARQFSH